MILIYGAVALLSILLWLGYYFLAKDRERNFVMLFGCIAAVNSGYFLLAASGSLAMARFANGLSYFGAAYSVLAMLLTVMNVCRMPRKKWRMILVTAVSTAAFLLAASADWLGLYYVSLDITTRDGLTLLVKEYGPLHILYTVYLLSYVLLMVGIILYSAIKKRLASGKYAVFLIATVLLNIGVWAVEQAIDEVFELLSISYIVSAVLLLTISGLLRDYGILQPGTGMLSAQALRQMNRPKPAALPSGIEELFSSFAAKVRTLSPAEHRILQYYIQGYDATDVPDLAHISIHTVKKHNRSIYQKLEVASRDELMLYIELFRSCDRLDELTDQVVLAQMIEEAAI